MCVYKITTHLFNANCNAQKKPTTNNLEVAKLPSFEKMKSAQNGNRLLERISCHP